MKGVQDWAVIGTFWFLSLDTYSAILADSAALPLSISLKSVGLLVQYNIGKTGRTKRESRMT